MLLETCRRPPDSGSNNRTTYIQQAMAARRYHMPWDLECSAAATLYAACTRGARVSGHFPDAMDEATCDLVCSHGGPNASQPPHTCHPASAASEVTPRLLSLCEWGRTSLRAGLVMLWHAGKVQGDRQPGAAAGGAAHPCRGCGTGEGRPSTMSSACVFVKHATSTSCSIMLAAVSATCRIDARPRVGTRRGRRMQSALLSCVDYCACCVQH